MAQPTAQSGRTSQRSSAQPNGIVRSYDAQGWLLRSTSYREGRMAGAELLFGAAGGALCTLPLSLAGDLERGELSPDLRWALAAEEIRLSADAVVTIVEPEREYLIEQFGESYSVRVMDGYLAVMTGRLVRATLAENDRIVARTHYQGGRLEGERATYDPPGEPLFALSLDFQPDLDSGNIKGLQLAFLRHGHALPDDALIAVELGGKEWRVTQSDQMLSVLRTDNQLLIYPGRVARRAIFSDGRLIETAHYQAGKLHGTVTIYGPLGPALFSLDPALRAALETQQPGLLARVFQQNGHLLAPDAIIAVVVEGAEWFIAQAGQSYTIQRGADALTVHRGRVISRSSYARGKLDGATGLYDEQGILVQQVHYQQGRLHGPMTVYAAGLKQTLVTFEHGKKHGPLIAYDKQGRPSMISQYQDDQLDGELCLYKEGSLQALATYRGGVQHGRSIAYHASGLESLVAQYADGLLDAESVLYNETGQVVKTSQYRQGKLEGAVIEYYPSGTVRTHATYHDDKLEGIVYLYDDQGRLKEKTHYRNGAPIGKPERRSWRQILTQR